MKLGKKYKGLQLEDEVADEDQNAMKKARDTQRDKQRQQLEALSGESL